MSVVGSAQQAKDRRSGEGQALSISRTTLHHSLLNSESKEVQEQEEQEDQKAKPTSGESPPPHTEAEKKKKKNAQEQQAGRRMAAELDDEDGYPIVEGVFVTPESESDNNNKDDDDLEGMDLASLSRDLDHFHENEAVQVALAHNVDLTAYSRTTDAELQELEDDVIAQHFAEADKVAGLAVDMDKCGAMLEKMQDMLQLFQKNLSQVSAEMRRLQNGCEDLDTKLKNRRRVERRLRKFIEHIVVSPAMKHTIETQPVKDATFAKALAVLNEKISFIRAGMDVALLGATERVRGSTPSVNGKKGSEKGRDDVSLRSARLSWLGGVRPADTVSVQQIIPDLEDLRRTAVGRIQEFFVSIFTDIRQAEGEQGAQMMLQNSLQKHTVRFWG